jgi:transcriptional regulator with XRE-family HTH domain
MANPEVIRRAGAKLRTIRLRLGLSLREMERRSLTIVADRQNREFNLSKAWITDIEKGRFVPGSFKVVSLAEIYGLTIAEIHGFYGIQPGDITQEPPMFRPPKTQLLPRTDESLRSGGNSETKQEIADANLVTQLVNIWGDVPVPLLRHLNLRRCLFGYIGASDRTMAPLLPPGTFVQIDPKQTRVHEGPPQKDMGQSQFARPIYFLDIRTGYACGWCQIKDGVLTLISHPHSGEPTRTFRYPAEAEVVGRVIGVAMQITGEEFTSIAERTRRSPTKE